MSVVQQVYVPDKYFHVVVLKSMRRTILTLKEFVDSTS
ncbi:unnamed protein product [Schistosoma curassoni]|nr:unnamed protein product [Schistosoma curassoni]